MTSQSTKNANQMIRKMGLMIHRNGMWIKILQKTSTTTATIVRKMDCQQWKRTFALWL